MDAETLIDTVYLLLSGLSSVAVAVLETKDRLALLAFALIAVGLFCAAYDSAIRGEPQSNMMLIALAIFFEFFRRLRNASREPEK